MSGGAIVARQNMYMYAFRRAGAVSRETAKPLDELKVRPIGIFRRMEKAGVFERTEEGRYFMNEQKAEAFVLRRARYSRLVLLIFGGVLLLLYLLNGRL